MERAIDFDPAARRIRRGEGAALDHSGIAKCYDVDLVAKWLLAHGIRHFLLELGGELRCEGILPDSQRRGSMSKCRRPRRSRHGGSRSTTCRLLGQLSPRFQRGRPALFARLRSGDGLPYRQWRVVGYGGPP
ncbi:MAG: FAD:protein FMN transferase [Sphingopyxis sp.]|nr:FAD:protein FMN transferase [Sphingopyxis sp.]